MTHQELIAALEKAEAECERLRKLAHEAPFAEYSMDHRGHTAIVHHTNAWADRGREWMAACDHRDALKARAQTGGGK